MILTVTLNPAIDVSMEVNGLQPGAVNRARNVKRVIGGKGIMVSRMLAKLKAKSVALTFAAGKCAEDMRDLAGEVGIDLHLTMPRCSNPGSVRINTHILDTRSGEHLKINQPGEPMTADDWKSFRGVFDSLARDAKLVCLCGSLPPQARRDRYAILTADAHALGVPVLIDANGPPLIAALKENPEYVKLNRAELEETLGVACVTLEDKLRGARKLCKMGAGSVIVTDGGESAVAVTRDGEWVGSVKINQPIKGATGAGDCCTAGFAFEIVRGISFQNAFRFGLACGTASCLRQELEIPTRNDVMAVKKNVRVKRWIC
ncbi:1-phosphofructokinase [soil metagenome]